MVAQRIMLLKNLLFNGKVLPQKILLKFFQHSKKAHFLIGRQSYYDQGGVIALAPNYGNRQGDTKLPEQYHELVLKAYLDQNKRSARSIYNHIIHQVALSKLEHEANFRELAEYKRELKTELSEYIILNFIKNQASKGLCSKARGEKLEREKVLSLAQEIAPTSSPTIFGYPMDMMPILS